MLEMEERFWNDRVRWVVASDLRLRGVSDSRSKAPSCL